MKRTLAAVLAGLLLGGCDTLAYYGQAVSGQFGILAAAKPVGALLQDPATPEALRAKLETARRIRDFASRELALPDNDSYRSYAELGRPYAVWNVFAAPELSVSPKEECFPITGCVAYRGFFSEQAARRHADRLRAQGLDVYVGGVPAYSTLGWFNDPLLSTFIRYPDSQLARLVFHELAHQVVYAPDDTTFNESFAVAVEEEGVKRWLKSEGRVAELEAFRKAQARRQALADDVKAARSRLAALYREPLPQAEIRARKKAEFDRLRAAWPGIVPLEPNNAFLVSIALYNERVPELQRLLRESSSLPAFYARAKSGVPKAKPPGPAASSVPPGVR
jgi:predicted aminopeptidase